MIFGDKSLLGIDIGANSIKLVRLTNKKKTWTLNSFGMAPTPAQCFDGGEIVEPEYLSTVIRQLVAEAKIKQKNSALGLSGSGIIVKTITVPKIDKKLIAEQIRWEAEQYIPYDVNDVNLDYQVLPEKDPDSNTMDLLLVAAVHNFIFKLSSVVHDAGLRPKILDVDAFACYKPIIHDGMSSNVEVHSINGTSRFYNSVKEFFLNEINPKMEFILSGNGESPYQEREQWTDGCNLVSLKPGVALTYDRNTKTNEAFEQKGYTVISAIALLEKIKSGELNPNEVENTIITLPSNELSRARGGSHCMTCPIERV